VIVVQHKEALVVVHKLHGFCHRRVGRGGKIHTEAADKTQRQRSDVHISLAFEFAANGEDETAVIAAAAQVLEPVAVVLRLRKRWS
jgi:hypothetical protein